MHTAAIRCHLPKARPFCIAIRLLLIRICHLQQQIVAVSRGNKLKGGRRGSLSNLMAWHTKHTSRVATKIERIHTEYWVQGATKRFPRTSFVWHWAFSCKRLDRQSRHRQDVTLGEHAAESVVQIVQLAVSCFKTLLNVNLGCEIKPLAKPRSMVFMPGSRLSLQISRHETRWSSSFAMIGGTDCMNT